MGFENYIFLFMCLLFLLYFNLSRELEFFVNIMDVYGLENTFLKQIFWLNEKNDELHC